MVSKTTIKNIISDSISDFFYYNRKEDEDCPVGAIEEAVKDGTISKTEIIGMFIKELKDGLK